jgi:GTP-binding protein
MKITDAKFLTTVVDGDKILRGVKNEIAFVGRSNVGKSSLINALTNQKNLANTSKTAGLTKHINYFVVNGGELHFVDLPGYGYHKRGKSDTERWATLIDRYLKTSPNLKGIVMLVDINVDTMSSDLEMVEFLKYFNIKHIVVCTKADKLSKAQQANALVKLKRDFGQSEIIVTSASNRTGIDDLVKQIANLIK